MIACDSCFSTNGCTLDSFFNLSAESLDRLAPRFVGDPTWNRIRAEAKNEFEREPILRPLIQQVVLDRHSLGDGLAMLLSQRLCEGASNQAEFYEAFSDVILGDNTITDSARKDLLAIRSKDPATKNLLHPLLNFKGFLAIQAYRVAHSLWMRDRKLLAHHIQSRASEVFGVDIHPAASIGSGVFIDHATGVVIGETAVVGDDVTILHGVTLGGTGNDDGDRHPKIGPGVYIGANAQLLGNIAVGEGSRIGANSVVLKRVDPYSTVAGVPAQVVGIQSSATTPGRGRVPSHAVSDATAPQTPAQLFDVDA